MMTGAGFADDGDRTTNGNRPDPAPIPQEVLNARIDARHRELHDLAMNEVMSRSAFFQRFMNPGTKDIDEECGYPRTGSIDPFLYKEMYDREPIATRVVQLMPKECWAVSPMVFEDEGSDEITDFEQAWDDLARQLRGQSWFQDEEGSPIWECLYRADELSGIGHFGVVLLGFDDGKALHEPVDGVVSLQPTGNRMVLTNAEGQQESIGHNISIPRMDPKEAERKNADANYVVNMSKGPTFGMGPYADKIQGTDAQYVGVQFGPSEYPATKPSGKQRKLTFMRAFDESLVQIVQYEANLLNPRFGMPVMYRITLNDPREQHSGVGLPMATVQVHWSRVLHLADNRGSSQIFGVPRQRPVLNPLLDIRKVRSGSAEMYWQGALPGWSLETHPQLGGDVEVDDAANEKQMTEYRKGLKRWLSLMGMSAKSLAPQVSDPTSQITVQIEAVCIQLGCPVRVFKGSERGELASTQDDSSWNDRVRGRQLRYVTPYIIVPFVDRMIAAGVLPEPKKGKTLAHATPKIEAPAGGGKGGAPGGPPGSPSSSSGASGASGSPKPAGGPPKPSGPPAGGLGIGKPGGTVGPATNANPRGDAAFEEDTEEEDLDGERPNGPKPGQAPPNGKDPKKDKSVRVYAEAGYSVEWPDLDSTGKKDKAAIFNQVMTGLSAYVAGNVQQVVPPMEMLTEFLGLTEEKADAILEGAQDLELSLQDQHQQMADDDEEGDMRKLPPPGFERKPEPPVMLGPDGKPLPGQGPMGDDDGPPGAGGLAGKGPQAPPGAKPKEKDGDYDASQFGGARNQFCPTGVGGGVDPSCGGDGSGGSGGGGSGGAPKPGGMGGGLHVPDGKGTGTKEDPIRCGKDLKLAMRALHLGLHVQLKQPDQVCTIVKKLDKAIQKAVALGKKAPDIDLCKVSVAGTNLFCEEHLGIPRVQMPQMRGLPRTGSYAATLKAGKKSGKVDLSADFIAHMKENGIKSEEVRIRASHLRASQNQIVGSRVAQLVREAVAGDRDLREKPIFVTRDNYVVDGHHHWAADIAFGLRSGRDLKVPVHKLDCDIGTALRMANEFTAAKGLLPKSGATTPTKNVMSDAEAVSLIRNGWVTLGGGQHVFIGDDGKMNFGKAGIRAAQKAEKAGKQTTVGGKPAKVVGGAAGKKGQMDRAKAAMKTASDKRKAAGKGKPVGEVPTATLVAEPPKPGEVHPEVQKVADAAKAAGVPHDVINQAINHYSLFNLNFGAGGGGKPEGGSTPGADRGFKPRERASGVSDEQKVSAVKSLVGSALKTPEAAEAWSIGQNLAERISRARGASPEKASQLKATLSMVDRVASKPLSWVVGKDSKLSGMPVATAAYVAWSTVRNPFAVIKSAFGVVKDMAKERVGQAVQGVKAAATDRLKTAVGLNAAQDTAVARTLANAIDKHDGSDWYFALLVASLKNGGTVDEAIALADASFEKQKESPVANEFREEDHPRDHGKFTSGGGSGPDPKEGDKGKDKGGEKPAEGKGDDHGKEGKDDHGGHGSTRGWSGYLKQYDKDNKPDEKAETTLGKMAKAASAAVGSALAIAGKPISAVVTPVKAAIGRMGQKAFDALPDKGVVSKSSVTAVIHAGQAVEHWLEGFHQAGQEAAISVAKGWGMNDHQVAKLGRVLGTADGIARWTANVPAAHSGIEIAGEAALHAMGCLGGPVAFLGAKAGFYTPVASLAFVAAAGPPLAAMKAIKGARSGIRSLMNKRSNAELRPAFNLAMNAEPLRGEKRAHLVAAAMDKNGFSHWFEACLYAALDETGGDAELAVRLAQHLFDQQKGPGAYGEEEA